MIRSRLPQGIVSLHPFETNQDVLHGLIQGMSHMELPGDIWRRNDNRKRFLRLIHFGMKIFFIQPFLIQSVFYALRVIGFCKFFAHKSLLYVVKKNRIKTPFI